MTIETPDWVRDAVFYQVFPDRFARGGRVNTGLIFEDWDSPPTTYGFKGGDLYGLIDRLDYLTDLGITAIYLNPIFKSASNHRYHTYDYFEVDPLLGGNSALITPVAASGSSIMCWKMAAPRRITSGSILIRSDYPDISRFCRIPTTKHSMN